MRKILVAMAISLTCVGAGCKLNYSQADVVEIPGGETDEQKLASAESIARDLWNGPLKPYIIQSVPGVSAADLNSGLGLRWETFKMTSFTDPAKSTSKVHIKCIFGSNHKDERTAKIVAACKRLVSEAVKKHSEDKAAAHQGSLADRPLAAPAAGG